MRSINIEELDEDEDGWIHITLTVITDDPALLSRARKAMKAVVDDTPRLSAINGPRNDDNA
jgi:hypothetical protein